MCVGGEPIPLNKDIYIQAKSIRFNDLEITLHQAMPSSLRQLEKKALHVPDIALTDVKKGWLPPSLRKEADCSGTEETSLNCDDDECIVNNSSTRSHADVAKRNLKEYDVSYVSECDGDHLSDHCTNKGSCVADINGCPHVGNIKLNSHVDEVKLLSISNSCSYDSHVDDHVAFRDVDGEFSMENNSMKGNNDVDYFEDRNLYLNSQHGDNCVHGDVDPQYIVSNMTAIFMLRWSEVTKLLTLQAKSVHDYIYHDIMGKCRSSLLTEYILT